MLNLLCPQWNLKQGPLSPEPRVLQIDQSIEALVLNYVSVVNLDTSKFGYQLAIKVLLDLTMVCRCTCTYITMALFIIIFWHSVIQQFGTLDLALVPTAQRLQKCCKQQGFDSLHL